LSYAPTVGIGQGGRTLIIAFARIFADTPRSVVLI